MFKTNFQLMQFHGQRLDILENMLPWERDTYVSMLVKHLMDERERRANAG